MAILRDEFEVVGLLRGDPNRLEGKKGPYMVLYVDTEAWAGRYACVKIMVFGKLARRFWDRLSDMDAVRVRGFLDVYGGSYLSAVATEISLLKGVEGGAD